MVLSTLLFRNPVVALVRMSLSQDDASYLVLIPFISAWVFYIHRKKVFLNPSSDKILGGTFLFLAGCVALAARLAENSSLLGLQLSAWILSLELVWVAGFVLLFGKAALRAAHFPLLFLLLMVPTPNFLLDRIIYVLQEGSAWIAGAFFDLVGVPALRDGLVFHLARVNIEVAKECSGIRSSMALLILALLISHFRLKSFWYKILFVACGLFMMILKNGIRIATLTLLAMYVDPSFLFGRLHHQGGVVFFVLALLLLLPLLFFLQNREFKRPLATEPSQTSQPSSFPN
jgi:exosortase